MQRAITAQQIYGEANRRIIPTPEAIDTNTDVQKLRKRDIAMPKQLIHVQGEFKLFSKISALDLPHVHISKNLCVLSDFSVLL